MSEQQSINTREVRLIIRLLDMLRKSANEATLSGAGRGGESYARQQFNAILGSLGQQGVALPAYFPPLPEDANLGAVSFAAAQVAEYLKELLEPEKEESGSGGHAFFDGLFSGGDFSHIGETIRNAMPDWMQRAAAERAGSRAWVRSEATSHSFASPRRPSGVSEETTQRLAELSARIQAVTQEMQREGLSPEELQRL